MRWDLPRRCKEVKRRLLEDAESDADANTALEMDVYTATSKRSVMARLSWWQEKAKSRGIEPYPLTSEKLLLMAALLKAGRYRSAQQYLYTAKREHARRGHAWDAGLTVLLGDARRSCARGLGGSRQAQPLPLEAAGAADYEGTAVADAMQVILLGS